MQLVTSKPGSVAQPWHADNARGGITVVIAMRDQSEAMGPTQLIEQSHLFHQSAWSLQATGTGSGSWLGTLFGVAAGVVTGRRRLEVTGPALNAGDVLVYDGRTIHRGPANRSAGDRPILVLRYDVVGASPPGQSGAESAVIAAFGVLFGAR